MNHMLLGSELCPASEIDCDHSADIGDRKLGPADEFVVGEPCIEPARTVIRVPLVFISSADPGQLGIEIFGPNAENDPDRVSIPLFERVRNGL
jgi:hypothetical protein